jgi:NAD(P)-dependent dehydrogenase (short-subunit alcohol dehydrogenase family)
LARAVERLGGSARVFTHPVDVRDGRSVADFVQATERAIGPVTVAVANAGVFPNSPVLDITTEEWDRVIETNLRGVFLTCQAVARRMVAEGMPGKLITISSGAYNSGRKGAAHYCASKAGVVMFTKVLAMELGPHRINVNRARDGHARAERHRGARRGPASDRRHDSLGPAGGTARRVFVTAAARSWRRSLPSTGRARIRCTDHGIGPPRQPRRQNRGPSRWTPEGVRSRWRQRQARAPQERGAAAGTARRPAPPSPWRPECGCRRRRSGSPVTCRPSLAMRHQQEEVGAGDQDGGRGVGARRCCLARENR